MASHPNPSLRISEEAYIKRCLDSLLNQDYPNYEIIVVDDGSTDDSIDIVKVLNSNKIRIVSKKNGGLSSARNHGIKHCSSTAQYIMFVDSDDAVDPRYISTMVNQLEKQNSDLVICGVHHCNDITYNSNDRENTAIEQIELYNNIWHNKNFISKLPFGIINSVCTKCFKMNIIRKFNLEFPQTLPEDTLFNISYLEHINSVSYLNYPLYHYIHRGNTMSTKPNELIFKNYELIQAHLLNIVPPSFQKSIYDFGYPHYLANVRAYLKIGDRETPNNYLKRKLIRNSILSHKSTCIGDFMVKILLLFRQYSLLMKLSKH